MIPTLSLNKNSQGRPQRTRASVNRSGDSPGPQRQRTRGHQFQSSVAATNKSEKFTNHSSTDSDDDILVIPSNREIDITKLEEISSSAYDSDTIPVIKETANWAPKTKREPIKSEPKEPTETDEKVTKTRNRPRRQRKERIKAESSDEELPNPSQPQKNPLPGKNEEEDEEEEKPQSKPPRRAVKRQQQFQPTDEKLKELQDINPQPQESNAPPEEAGVVSSDGAKRDNGRDHLTSLVILREKHVFGHAKYKGTVNEKPIFVAERDSHAQFGKVFTIYKGREREIVGYLRVQQRGQRFTLIIKQGLEYGEVMGYAYVIPKEGDQQARCISVVGSNNSKLRQIPTDKNDNLSRIAKVHYVDDGPVPEGCFAFSTELPKITKNGNLQLNFSGAHVVPSVKNFVIRTSEKALLMCFRFSTDCFNVMYCDPFDQLMAFGFCLTALEGVIPD